MADTEEKHDFVVYCANFPEHPEVGFYIGFSRYHFKSQIRGMIMANAKGTSGKMSKAIAAFGTVEITILEKLFDTKENVAKRVTIWINHNNSVEKGLNEHNYEKKPRKPAKPKRKICTICNQSLASTMSLRRHTAAKHPEPTVAPSPIPSC